MELPVYIFLIIYFIAFVIWLVLAIATLYHMLKFAIADFSTILVTMIFLIGSAIILLASFQAINNIDWSQSISLFSFGAVNSPF